MPAILILIGAILSAFGALWASQRQEREKTQSAQEKADFEHELRIRGDEQIESQRQLREKSDEIAALHQTIASSQRELKAKADLQAEAQRDLRIKGDEIAELNRRIAEAQRDLRIKSDEIVALNKQISDSITGGDSYCYMASNVGAGNTDSPMATLIHKGSFPLYDVQIRIVDVNRFKQLSQNGITLDNIFAADTLVNIGNLPPHIARSMGSWKLPTSNEQDYDIFITSRNGSFAQRIMFRRVNGTWRVAYRVKRNKYMVNSPDELLEEFIEPEFPRDNNGQIQW